MAESSILNQNLEFANNPEPRCPCVLLLDTSGSMNGAAIEALNQGLIVLKNDLLKDPLASLRVELAVITFDSTVRQVQDFVTPDNFNPPTLTAQEQTHMGSGIHAALDAIEQRKTQYKSHGVAYYRPWIFMITDGAPQGEPENVVLAAAQRVREAEASKRVCFFAVGVEGADMQRLTQISARQPVKLMGLNFAEMFVWLSRSAQAVTRADTQDEQIALPPAGGWATT